MAEEKSSFDVVRRGYDQDQVDRFVVKQAEAWRGAVAEVEARLAAAQTEIDQLRPLAEEVEQSRRQQEALTITLASAAQARDQMLAQAEEDSRLQREAATAEAERLRSEAEEYALQMRSEADAHAVQVRSEADAYAVQVRSEADGEAESVRSEAATEAERVRSEAESELARVRSEAESEVSELQESMRADILERARTMEEAHKRRTAELDANHQASTDGYRQLEEALRARVTDLHHLRLSLVTGLEAIATGGLARLGELEGLFRQAGLALDQESGAVSTLPAGSPPASAAAVDAAVDPELTTGSRDESDAAATGPDPDSATALGTGTEADTAEIDDEGSEADGDTDGDADGDTDGDAVAAEPGDERADTTDHHAQDLPSATDDGAAVDDGPDAGVDGRAADSTDPSAPEPSSASAPGPGDGSGDDVDGDPEADGRVRVGPAAANGAPRSSTGAPGPFGLVLPDDDGFTITGDTNDEPTTELAVVNAGPTGRRAAITAPTPVVTVDRPETETPTAD